MSTVAETLKKSTLQAKDNFDYKKLIYPVNGFLPCTFEETLEEVTFTYDITEKKPYSEMWKEKKENQYQFLINFAFLAEKAASYQFRIEEDNLYYDENMLPLVKTRDIYGNGQKPDEEQFLYNYKCIVGGILSKKYSMEKLQKSGLDMLNKDKKFQAVYASESIEDLVAILKAKKQLLLELQKKTKKEVGKNSFLIWRVAAVVAMLCMLGTGSYSVYAAKEVVPKQQAVIEGNQKYIGKDYVSCIDSMEILEPAEMDQNTKYILAVSYAESESFKKEEMEEIISRLSPTSNVKELEYWIYLGRQNLTEAENLALSLSDDKLLIYAYMKELDILESDTTMEGEEKKSRISTLEQEIEALGKKYETETSEN